MRAELIVNGNVFSPEKPDLLPEDTPMRAELIAALREWYSDKDIRISTSGSTGEPKIITLDRESIKGSAAATIAYFGIPEGCKSLLCLPVDRIAGRMMLYRALLYKWKLTITAPTSSPMQRLENDSFHFGAMTPMQVRKSLEQQLTGVNSIRKLIIGGAPVGRKLELHLQRTQSQCYETYGMTETYTHLAVRKLTPSAQDHFECLPGVKVGKNKEGCLVVEAAHLKQPVHTTDRIELIDERHFRWLGRADFVINSGGIKFNAEQLEAAIEGMLRQRYFIAGEADDLLGERIVLVTEGSLPPAAEIAAIKRRMIDIHGQYAVPRAVKTMDVFETTSTGKIKRQLTQ